MKTKHLFYSLALASAFVACTQEELVEAPVVKDNVANRPVAGVVEFSTEGVESRFNYEKANGFELGDIFGLYLMDEYDDNFPCTAEDSWEHGDANTTLWKWQDHWFGMYSFVNNIQSNYPFRYVKENGKNVWKNDAKLVEGNYFAMFPQNEKALNRRDLWHVIDPAVDMMAVSTSTSDNKKFQHVENQFWLGYKQIYRDATASAEGVMSMDIDMKGVLVPLRISLLGWQGNDVKLDKISFKDKYGKPLPTIAYVEPATYERGAWVKRTGDVAEWINCGNTAHGVGLYDEAKTWTKRTVQSLVRWAIPGENGEYPYGLEDADRTTAYEYSFEFPANTILKGDVNNGDLVTAYIVVPALNDADMWNSLQVTVYGWRYIKKSTGNYWEYGLLTSSSDKNQASDNKNNYTFLLSEHVNAWLDQSEGTNYYRDVEVRFDNLAWTAASESVSVASTEDMEKMVLAHLQEVKNKDVELTIRPDAAGVEVRKSFIDALDKVSTEEGRSIKINFWGGRDGKVYFNEDNTMAIDMATASETSKKLTFNYGDGIKLINNAAQKVQSGFSISNAPIENNGTLNVEGYVEYVENIGTMTVASNDWIHGNNDQVGTIDNLGLVTLKCNAKVGTLNNNSDGIAGKVVVDAFVHNTHKDDQGTAYNFATVNQFNNNYTHECGNCHPAELTVKTGTLKTTELVNDAILTIEKNAAIDVATELMNKKHAEWNHSNVNKYTLVNKGTIKGIGKITNDGMIENHGTISTEILNNYLIDNGCVDCHAFLTGAVGNAGRINAYNGTIQNLKNAADGELYVYSLTNEVKTSSDSHGKIIFVGVDAEHIGTQGSDIRIFRTIEAMDAKTLFLMMEQTATTWLWTAYDVTFATKTAQIFTSYMPEITQIKIEGDKVNFSGVTNAVYEFENAEVVVNKNCQWHIENGITVKVNSCPNYAEFVHVGTNSLLELIGSGEKIDHNSVAGGQNIPVDGYTLDVNGKINTYKIYNAKGLIAVSEKMNGVKATYKYYNFELMGDIDMTGENWTPIDFFEPETPGTFDGKDYTIKGLNAPLFKSVVSSIKNLTLDGSVITNYSYGHAGAIAGNLYGDVENVTVKNAKISMNDGKRVGAIIGIHNSGKATSCTVENATIIGKAYTAGLISGFVNETNTNRIYENCKVSNCTINADAVNGALTGAVYGISFKHKNCTIENTIPSTLVGGIYNGGSVSAI